MTEFRTLLNRYSVLERIGEGGSGVVLKAQSEHGELVAIKRLKEATPNEGTHVRFRNEIRFGSRSRHPNVVPIIDFGKTSSGRRGRLFFVMPLYPLTLRRAMAHSLSAEQALLIFDKVLSGIHAAHMENVWHRDLKPENILMSEDMAEVCIADFGIAHFAQHDVYTDAKTRMADRLANFQYAAPEQRKRNANRDHRVDIFSLGLILNEMLTGEAPYGSSYRRVSEVHSGHAYMDQIIDRMTRQRPEDRFSSAKEIRERLGAIRQRSGIREEVADSNNQKPGSQMEATLLQTPWRLFFNPARGLAKSKVMVFAENGRILQGKNANEASWRIVAGKLELIDSHGLVHSRFSYDSSSKRFSHTNDPGTGSITKHGIRDQYLVPA